MADNKVPDSVLALIAYYKASQVSIIDYIATLKPIGGAATYTEKLQKKIVQLLHDLDTYALAWCRSNIPEFYAIGWDATYKALLKAGVALESMPANTLVLQNLIENSYMDLYDAHRYVGRAVNDQIRQAGLQAVGEGYITGSDIHKALIHNLTNRGITAIRDKRGREIRLDAYAALVARSTTHEATNQATIDQMQRNGQDLVRMSSHATACAICIPLEGRVYSISGTDPRFPPLSRALTPPYANIHCNCLHLVLPFIANLDDNLEETIRQSNRSYELDPEMQKRVDRYNKQQEVRRKMRADRLQWERYKFTVPDKVPKTFSGFRRSKASNSENWKELQSAYRKDRS